jgi:hypothetical protein
MLKTNQEKMDAYQATAHADRKAYREDLKEIKDEIKEEMRSTVSAIEGKLETAINSIRSELKDVNNLTQYLCKEVTETFGLTQAVKTSFETRTKDMKIIGEETMACHETMEARLQGEPASVDRTPEMAQEREAPRDDAVDMPVGEPRKRHRDQRNLAAVCRQKKQDQNLDEMRHRIEQRRAQRKDGCRRNLVAARRGTTRCAEVARRRTLLTKETRGYCGSQKRVIVVYRKMPRHATVAWRKRHIRSTVERATQRVGRLRKNLQSRKESSKATKNLGGKQPLYPEKRNTTGIGIGGWSLGQLSPLGRRGPTYKILKKTLKLESVKQAKGMPSGLQTSKQWTLWRGRPPPKCKK